MMNWSKHKDTGEWHGKTGLCWYRVKEHKELYLPERLQGYWCAVFFKSELSHTGNFIGVNSILIDPTDRPNFIQRNDWKFNTKEAAMAACERHHKLLVLQ